MIISIFYNRSSWHDLITNVIKPFIQQEQNILKTYYIYLSSNQGDHITFAAKPQDNNDKFQQRFSILIERFLLANPSETKAIKYPLQSFFMDYPNNSFCFNKDKLLVQSSNNRGSKLIQQQVSKAIIDSLGNEEIELDDIYTFITYMQLGIIKAAHSDIKSAYCSVKKLIDYCHDLGTSFENATGADDRTNIELLLDSNKNVLSEIIEDIWNEDNHNSEIEWLEEWIAVCKEHLTESGFNHSFIHINRVIYEHTGLKGSSHIISLRLILYAFKQVA